MKTLIKLIASSAAILAMGHTAYAANTDTSTVKAEIVSQIQTYIAEKEKTFETGGMDAAVTRICTDSKAISCHKFRISEIKRKKRAVNIMTMLAEGCLAAGGEYKKSDQYPSKDGISQYFNKHKLEGDWQMRSGQALEKRDVHMGCWVDGKPELFLNVLSMEPYRADPKEISGLLMGAKTRMYIMIYDADNLRSEFAQFVNQMALDEQKYAIKKRALDACLAAKPQVGEESNKGLIIEIKGPVAQVQSSSRLEWVKTETLKRSVTEC